MIWILLIAAAQAVSDAVCSELGKILRAKQIPNYPFYGTFDKKIKVMSLQDVEALSFYHEFFQEFLDDDDIPKRLKHILTSCKIDPCVLK